MRGRGADAIRHFRHGTHARCCADPQTLHTWGGGKSSVRLGRQAVMVAFVGGAIAECGRRREERRGVAAQADPVRRGRLSRDGCCDDWRWAGVPGIDGTLGAVLVGFIGCCVDAPQSRGSCEIKYRQVSFFRGDGGGVDTAESRRLEDAPQRRHRVALATNYRACTVLLTKRTSSAPLHGPLQRRFVGPTATQLKRANRRLRKDGRRSLRGL